MSYLISFVWHQSTCQERVEIEKMENEKFLLTVGLEPKALGLKSDALPTELTGLRWKLYYLNDLYVYMYFLY